jgi:hypothetical protein
MIKIADIQLKNLLQDYRLPLSDLFGRERIGLYALIEERYSNYPAEGNALIAVFDDRKTRNCLLGRTNARITTEWIRRRGAAIGLTSKPELIRAAIETWASELDLRIKEGARWKDNAPHIGLSPKQKARGVTRQDLRFVLSLIAVALALFLSGGAVLDFAFHNSSLDAIRHPLTHISESPFCTFVVLLFIGGVWGVRRGCSK